MKRILYFLIPAALIMGCSEAAQNEYVRCKINGVQYEDLDIGAYISGSDNAAFSGGFVTDSVTLVASIPNVTTTGTYNVYGPSGGEITILFYGTTYAIKSIYPQSHGTVTISEIGNQSPLPRIRGSFEGVAYNMGTDSLVITEGEFSGW